MYCSECGKAIDANAKFCGECGAPADVTEVPPPQPQAPQRKPPLSAPGEIFSSKTAARHAAAVATAAGSGSAPAARGMSIVGALLTLLALLLPWFQVSCGGVRVEIEGYRFLTGTTAEKVRPLTGQIGQLGGMLGAQNPRAAVTPGPEKPSISVILWLALILLAALLTSPRKSAGGGGALGAAALSAILLIYFYASTNSEAQGLAGQSMGMVQFQWLAGFWIAAAGTLLIGIGAAMRLRDTS